MGDPAYALPSDQILLSASSVTLNGTAEADYPVTNLYDVDPANPFMLTTAATFSVDVNIGFPEDLGFAAFFNHNMDPSTASRIHKFNDAGFSLPGPSVTITWPADREDGTSVAPYVDLTAITAAQYVKWNVSAINSLPPAMGEWWLSRALRTLSPVSSFRWGLKEFERRVTKAAQSDLGNSLVYDYGVTVRWLVGSLRTSASGLAQLRTLWRSCKGNVLPFVWIPDRDVNDARLVRFAAELQVTYVAPGTDNDYAPDTFDVEITLEEVSYGVPVREAG